MKPMCRDCGLMPRGTKSAICWRCHHKKYRKPKGYHGPHHCNYCGEQGHNIITCPGANEARAGETA